MDKRATLADVARVAGVAASTASVVFSGRGPVAEATRRKVLAAAADLGYAGPDPRAAALRHGRSGIVAVVFDDYLRVAFLDPVKTMLMDGLADAVAPLGAGLLLLRDAETGERAGPTLTSAPLDAAVLVGCSDELRPTVATLRRRGVPIVVVEADVAEDVVTIALDNHVAHREAARHLRGLGHQSVAVVTLPANAERRPGFLGDDDPIDYAVTRERLAGVREEYPDAPAYATTASSIDEGLAAGRVLFGPHVPPVDRPTAVIAQSDLLAAGVIRAAQEAGLRVPEDLSVVGFDGIRVDGIAPYEITTLVQDATGKGRAAGVAIEAMLNGTPAASLVLTCEFRVGNTTGPAPASSASPQGG